MTKNDALEKAENVLIHGSTCVRQPNLQEVCMMNNPINEYVGNQALFN